MADSTPQKPPCTIVSVDDHVVEPPLLWQERLPEKYRRIGPRVERLKGSTTVVDGKTCFTASDSGRWWDVWRYEDGFCTLEAIALLNEKSSHERDAVVIGTSPTATLYDDIRQGCFDPRARLADMDIAGVEASICFPNMFVQFAGQRFLHAKDKDLALQCVRAYNDWMIEEWSNPSGGRLLPLCLVPLWSPQLAADEVRRTAKKGNRAILFTETPHELGLPTLHTHHWDPFLKACEETNSVINIHIGTGSNQFTTSPDAPIHTQTALTFVSPAMAIVDWILSGTLVRFPYLRVSFAESQIGWIPYLLERLDRTWRHIPNWGWANGGNATASLPELPSHYFRENMLVCFFDDKHGIKFIDSVGAQNVAFETDYPHSDGTWPNSSPVLAEILSGASDVVKSNVTRDNAIRFFSMDSLPSQRASRAR